MKNKNSNNKGLLFAVKRAYREHKSATVTFITVNLLFLIIAIAFPLYCRFMWEGDGAQLGGCLMRRIFNLYCPVCGGTRSLYALIHFDIINSVIYNPLCLFLVACVAYFDLRAFIALLQNRPVILRIGRWFAIATAVIMVLTFIVRNLLLVLFAFDPVGDLGEFWQVYKLIN